VCLVPNGFAFDRTDRGHRRRDAPPALPRLITALRAGEVVALRIERLADTA